MKVFLETYGCQMNEYDSELIQAILSPHGYKTTTVLEEASVVLMNTCAIRENAHRKIYGRLDDLRPVKKGKMADGEPFVVAVLGCMAQNLKETLFDHPVVNLVVGPDNYKSLPRLIQQAIQATGRPVMEAYLSEYETYSDIAPHRVAGVNAWIAVMRGCDNFCTFCVVPYTRGRERCRSPENILNEARRLAEVGYRQVTLLGQNVNSYRYEGASFADLISAVAGVPGIQRVRFTSPHPKDFPEPLLAAIAAHPHICKHIHLPAQSGSDRILSVMNRTYTRREYLALVAQIRRAIPQVSITTDMIVGFPTETETDFQDTYDLMQQAEFDNAFIFKYSEREGTIAQRQYPDDVAADIKTDRIVRLFDLQHSISRQKNQRRVGETLEVLIEGMAEKRPNAQVGKSDGNRTVLFPNTLLSPGTFVPIRITDATQNTLYGEAV